MTDTVPPAAWPSYRALLRTGALRARLDAALEGLASCRMCPRGCDVDRLRDERGECGTGRMAEVASVQLHFGEEAPLVGHGGSGTIFFTHCNLTCTFCQNHEISHGGHGRPMTPEQLALAMVGLQEAGAQNVNLVSPSHVVPQILEALLLAAEDGLRIPLLYNSGGYDALATLRLLDGVVDIYMPDAKYGDTDAGQRYSGVPSYPTVNRAAIREMHRQVGDLQVDERGIARRGLLVRHLVLPGGLAGTRSVMRFLAREISPKTSVNIMDQYRPCYHARNDEHLGRALRGSEYRHALQVAEEEGIENKNS